MSETKLVKDLREVYQKNNEAEPLFFGAYVVYLNGRLTLEKHDLVKHEWVVVETIRRGWPILGAWIAKKRRAAVGEFWGY